MLLHWHYTELPLLPLPWALHCNPGGFSWYQPSTKMNVTRVTPQSPGNHRAEVGSSPRPTSTSHYTSQHGFQRVENDLRIALTWHRMLTIYLHQQLSIFITTWGCSEERSCCQKFCNAPKILNHCWTPTWMERNKIVQFPLWHLGYHRMSLEEKHSAKSMDSIKNYAKNIILYSRFC